MYCFYTIIAHLDADQLSCIHATLYKFLSLFAIQEKSRYLPLKAKKFNGLMNYGLTFRSNELRLLCVFSRHFYVPRNALKIFKPSLNIGIL
jgi:hypothetical protein